MKSITLALLLFSVLMMGCAEKINKTSEKVADSTAAFIKVPDTTVDLSLLNYDNRISTWTLDEQLYSGHAVSYYPNGVLKEKISFWEGRKQDQAIQWFPDEHLKRISNYHRGKLHGIKKSWLPGGDHVLVAHLNYQMGKAHGKQLFWYPTGELYKKLNLNSGREEGLQQAFRKNGELYANYEAKDGRIFGLRKAALCYGLEDESIKYEN